MLNVHVNSLYRFDNRDAASWVVFPFVDQRLQIEFGLSSKMLFYFIRMLIGRGLFVQTGLGQ